MHRVSHQPFETAESRPLAHLRHGLVGSLVVAITMGCSKEPTPAAAPTLAVSLVASYALDVSEPSGLTIDESGTALWTVANQGIKKLDLRGNRIGSVDYNNDDLEGIAYDRNDGTLWIVEERLQRILNLDMDGNVLSQQQLALGGDVNDGLEGISVDEGGNVFALKEKDPALFLAVEADQSISSRNMSFAPDCSGLSYDRATGNFWVLSDKGQRLYMWNRSSGLLGEFALPFPKAEGVAYDEVAKLLYIVSDSENRLYVYMYQN